MSENMPNVLKENANIEVNEKQFIIFPASQIKVRFFVECTSVNNHSMQPVLSLPAQRPDIHELVSGRYQSLFNDSQTR